MKIDSGQTGYSYQGRIYNIERPAEEQAASENKTRVRNADAITGSSTLLSSSLAKALWAVDTGSHSASTMTDDSPQTIDQIRQLYMEYD